MKAMPGLDEKGFAIFSAVFSPQEIAAVINSLDAVGLPRSRAGIRHAMHAPLVANLAHSSRLMQLALEALGRIAVPFRATFFDKSPSSNWLVAWHQDTALPLCERHNTPDWGPWSVKAGVIYAHAPARALEQVVALRVHLDDSLPESGPLRVLPGSHRNGVLSDQEIRRLASEAQAVECLVPKGGVLAMRPLLVHSSSKSVSELPRRVLHFEYARSMTVEEGVVLSLA